MRLLLRWGDRINLTSRGRQSEPALVDLVDGCLTIVPHLPAGVDRIIDLGSGQGFPAIPLAIATGLPIEMIEADRRKAAFLTTAIAELGLSGVVHRMRIEDATLAPALCVTARALAPVDVLIKLAAPLLARDGCGLFLKGAAAAAELLDVPPHPSFQVELLGTDRPPTTLVKVTKLR